MSSRNYCNCFLFIGRLHNFARDKQGLHDWKQRQRIFPIDESSKDSSESSSSGASDEVGAGLASFLSRKVQASQYELLAKLRFIYPIQNPTQVSCGLSLLWEIKC